MRLTDLDVKNPLLIFDGDCGFCTTCAEWMRRRMKDTVEIAPGQSIDIACYGLTENDISNAAWWIDPAGRRYRGHRAIGMALKAAGGRWRVASWFCLVPPLSWVAAGGYRIVARYRYRLPGATAACRIERH